MGVMSSGHPRFAPASLVWGDADGQAERMRISFSLDHSGCSDALNLNVTLSAAGICQSGQRLRLSYLIAGTVIAQVTSCSFPEKERVADERSAKKKNQHNKNNPMLVPKSAATQKTLAIVILPLSSPFI